MDKLIKHFGGKSLLAKALRVNPAAVSQWIDNGYIPPRRAIEIEILTGGKFKAIELLRSLDDNS